MLSSTITAALSILALVSANDAPESHDSPTDVLYTAYFREDRFYGGLAFWSNDGTVTGSLSSIGYPRGYGPFDYEIAHQYVPPGGICDDAGEVLNPYDGRYDAHTWAGLPVGDLSGKHGTFNTPYYRKMYDDPFLSLNPQNEAFLGDKAVVVYKKDGSIYTCANFKKVRRSGRMVGTGKDKIPVEFVEGLPQMFPSNLSQAIVESSSSNSTGDNNAPVARAVRI